MRMKTLLAITAAVLLAACATQTEYKPAERRGDVGYTETQLGDKRYRVTFTGNSSTPAETVKDYALLRSAELTLQEGYEWFRIADRETDKTSRTTVQDSGAGFTQFRNQSSVYRRCGLLSCDTVVVQRSTPVATGGVVTTRTRDSYASSLEFVMGKGDVPDDVEVFDARELASTLRRWMGEQRR